MDDIQTLKSQITELKAEIQGLRSKAHQAALLSADREYRESQVRFRTVFEASRLGNKIISPELKILQVNPAMVALLNHRHCYFRLRPARVPQGLAVFTTKIMAKIHTFL